MARAPLPEGEPVRPAPQPQPPAPEQPRRFTEDVHALLDRARGGPVTIGEIVRTLRGRGMAITIIVLAAPFILPVPLPGLSTPVGIVIGLLGLRLALGLEPWLPARLRRRSIEHARMVALVRTADRVVGPLERILKPRYGVFFRRGLRSLPGLAIAAAAAILMLPLPFPGANAIPALGAVLLAAGLMERDGAFIVAGYSVVVGAFAYLYFWGDLLVKILRLLP